MSEVDLATEEIHGFLHQSNISKKNIKRLQQLASLQDENFQHFRTLVLEIARVKPHKRRRWRVLRQKHPLLFNAITTCEWFDYILDEACLDYGGFYQLYGEPYPEFDEDEEAAWELGLLNNFWAIDRREPDWWENVWFENDPRCCE